MGEEQSIDSYSCEWVPHSVQLSIHTWVKQNPDKWRNMLKTHAVEGFLFWAGLGQTV